MTVDLDDLDDFLLLLLHLLCCRILAALTNQRSPDSIHGDGTTEVDSPEWSVTRPETVVSVTALDRRMTWWLWSLARRAWWIRERGKRVG